MGKIKPERRNVGNSVTSSANWLAASCDLAVTENKYPSDSTTIRNSAEQANSTVQLPRKGTPNHQTAAPAQSAVSIIPMTK